MARYSICPTRGRKGKGSTIDETVHRMISIQFDSNFPPEIFVPLFGKWIAWKRTLGQVGPKLHALASDFEIYNWPSSYVRVNKESHPANQGGDKKKEEAWKGEGERPSQLRLETTSKIHLGTPTGTTLVEGLSVGKQRLRANRVFEWLLFMPLGIEKLKKFTC